MKRVDLSKIFIALYAMLLIMYVAVIIFDFQKEYFADTYLMNIVVLITLHLVVPFIYFEKYKEGKTVANVVQFLKNPFFIGYFVLSSLYLCKSIVDYQWYKILIVNVVVTPIIIFILELLKQYIVKHYKAEYYVIVCYFILFLIFLTKLICF